MILENTGISIYSVKKALGSSSNDVANLCNHKSINMWSKWKPIRCSDTTLDNEILIRENYGIKVAITNTPQTLLNYIEQFGDVVYNIPIGGKDSPYRLDDFRNYNNSAINPTTNNYKDGDIQKIEKKQLTNITLLSDNYNIGFYDVYPEIAKNRGLFLTDGTNSYWGTDTIDFSAIGFTTKEIKVMEFQTNVEKYPVTSNYTIKNDDIFCAIPNAIHTIKLDITGTRAVDVIGSCKYVNNTVQYSIKFSAKSNDTYGGTLKNVYVYLSTDKIAFNVIDYKRLGESINVPNNTETGLYTGTLNAKEYSNLLYVIIIIDNSIVSVLESSN